MAKQTSNFGFAKPDVNEFYNVQVQNENWDKADVKLANAFIDEDDFDKYEVIEWVITSKIVDKGKSSEMMYTLILADNYERADFEHKISVYVKRGRMTQEEADKLIAMMDAKELAPIKK